MRKKTLFFLLGLFVLSIVSIIFTNQAASFTKYAPKLLAFEGEGYGIHQPIWGEKEFTKEEALHIHKHYYWNTHKGNLFKNQQVAEVFIDHIINAGVGKDRTNVKAFERIIGAKPDGYISTSDVQKANAFEFPHEIVNAYVDYRLAYYRTRKNWREHTGWFKRAKSFYMPIPDEYYEQKEDFLEPEESQANRLDDYFVPETPKNSTKQSGIDTKRQVFDNGMVIEEYVVEPK